MHSLRQQTFSLRPTERSWTHRGLRDKAPDLRAVDDLGHAPQHVDSALLVPCGNALVHITVWTAASVKAAEGNELGATRRGSNADKLTLSTPSGCLAVSAKRREARQPDGTSVAR